MSGTIVIVGILVGLAFSVFVIGFTVGYVFGVEAIVSPKKDEPMAPRAINKDKT